MIDEVLCYFQNKVDRMPVDILVKVSSNFFSSEQVKVSKDLLFKIVQPSVRKRVRRGANGQAQNVRDIIDIFLLEQDIPKFVALDLNKLPPLNANDCDIFKVSKDIEELKQLPNVHAAAMSSDLENIKSEVDEIKVGVSDLIKTQKELITTMNKNTSDKSKENINNDKIKREIDEIKNSVSDLVKSQTELMSIMNKEAGPAQACSKHEVDIPNHITTSVRSSTPVLDNSYIVMDMTDCADSIVSSTDVGDLYSTISDSSFTTCGRHRKWPREERAYSPRYGTNNSRNNMDSSFTTSGRHRKWPREERAYSPRYRTNNSRHNMDFCISLGTGQPISIRTADMKLGKIRNFNIMPKENQTLAGIYVTRLAPNTTSNMIAKHVKQETGLIVKPERMYSKQSNIYSSWFIKTSKLTKSTLSNSTLWPKNSLIKPYFINA